MPDISAETIVDEARTWIGTPYLHQHRTKGGGVDCVGLILAVGEDTGALAIDPVDWAPFAKYSRTPNPAKMREAMERFLVPWDDHPRSGIVAWLKWREGLPMHLAILSYLPGYSRFLGLVHAYQDVGKCVEQGLDERWYARIDSLWRYPGMSI